MAIEIESKMGKITLEESEKLRDGLFAEIENLKSLLKDVEEFGVAMQLKHDLTSEDSNDFPEMYKSVNNDPRTKSTEAASQHIGYLEYKIHESLGTIDKILLETAVHIDDDKRENDVIETTDSGERDIQ